MKLVIIANLALLMASLLYTRITKSQERAGNATSLYTLLTLWRPYGSSGCQRVKSPL